MQDTVQLWLLIGPKAGDNAQLRALGAALAARFGWTVTEQPVAFHGGELLVTLLLRVSLLGLTSATRRALRGPWPELVLTAGRRNEPVARWIRRASGDRTRLVHVGRPWSHPRHFDLLISTPQYFLPEDRFPNVLTNPLPLVPQRQPPADLRAGPDDDPDEPLIACFIGGDSGAQVLTAEGATRIADAALALARAQGARLGLSTSARTPEVAEAAIADRLKDAPDVRLHLWHRAPLASNPYRAWLAVARGFVVTTDSMSMIAEAEATGRQLWLTPIPVPDRPWWLTIRGWRWKPLTHRLAQAFAPRRLRRDTQRIIDALLRSGRARPLAEGPQTPAATVVRAPVDGTARAVEAIAALFEVPSITEDTGEADSRG
ncbi:MAG: ELM1/GtrOC1 family putative glycosyltransferase [Pseudomonadales bacterium]|jgi:mitochondrial fission protein ELM1|nr:ELM1/GtrOC1 family putative glycosyltransferase [Pseudomonadales bacterium]